MKYLDSFFLKIIALVTMILDHAAIILLPTNSILYLIFRAIGRLSLPIYSFLIIEGINYSSSPIRYLLRLILIGLGFDLICYFFTDMNIGNTFTTFGICGLFCYLISDKNIINKFLSLIPLSIVVLSFINIIPLRLSYGIYGVTLIIFFFISKKLSIFLKEKLINVDELEIFKTLSVLSLVAITCLSYVFQQELKSLSSSFIMDYNIQTYSLIACFIILCYNGLRGYNTPLIKWGFYISYPLHILILLGMNLII